MGKLKHLSIFILMNIVFVSCIVPSFTSFNDVQRESKEENFVVRVYTQEQLNSYEYEIIGQISVEGCSCEIEKMLKKIKDRVRKEGGDGILDLSLRGGIGGRISTENYLISGKVFIFVKNRMVQ